jgi:hypothetical protein
VTIGACYLSPEGVVLGADSTTTYGTPTSPHYFNNAQKLFEVGEDSTLGAVTWGMGGLNATSHRSLLAKLDDSLAATPAESALQVAERWISLFWSVYDDPSSPNADLIKICRELASKPTRSDEEEKQLFELSNALQVGFCIAGRLKSRREPFAYEVIFGPTALPPVPRELSIGWQFWGAPNKIQRLIFGCDDGIKNAITRSGKWSGTKEDLDSLVLAHALIHPIVPIRDAVDFVHSCISSTIKAFKFSTMSQICGGPIELAVVTTDRPFRWVRHKAWDAAINEGGGA